LETPPNLILFLASNVMLQTADPRAMAPALSETQVRFGDGLDPAA
jgi:hypothetical protein